MEIDASFWVATLFKFYLSSVLVDSEWGNDFKLPSVVRGEDAVADDRSRSLHLIASLGWFANIEMNALTWFTTN